jgi:hypothetical protein
MPMTSQGSSEQAERELAEVKGLVDEQYGLVMRLKRIGADTQEAVRLLIDLLELQQTREQRLAQARIHYRQRTGRFARDQCQANARNGRVSLFCSLVVLMTFGSAG